MKYYLQVMEIHTSKDGFNSGRTYFFRSQVCKILRYRYISVHIGIGTYRCILTLFQSQSKDRIMSFASERVCVPIILYKG